MRNTILGLGLVLLLAGCESPNRQAESDFAGSGGHPRRYSSAARATSYPAPAPTASQDQGGYWTNVNGWRAWRCSRCDYTFAQPPCPECPSLASGGSRQGARKPPRKPHQAPAPTASQPPPPVQREQYLYVTAIQVAEAKADGSPWDWGGGDQGQQAAEGIANGARVLVLAAYPPAVVVNNLVLVPASQALARALVPLIGQAAAPDLVLIVSVDDQHYVGPLVRDSHLAGWRDPFCVVPPTAQTVTFYLWDADLSENDQIFTASYRASDLRRGGRIGDGRTVLLVEIR